jgi:hypothetical protein
MDAGAGAGAGAPYASRTAEEVFRDFRGRRAGMIKALTHGRRPRPPLASGFSRPPAPASLTRLLCLLGWCFFLQKSTSSISSATPVSPLDLPCCRVSRRPSCRRR